MTSIDGIVKSEIIKEKSYFFLVWKFQEKVENGSLASRSKQFFLEAPHKAKYSLALILLSLFCWRWEIGNGSNIHVIDFHDTYLTYNDVIGLFQRRMPGTLISFDLKSVLARQTLERVAYKTWHFLEYFLVSTLARIITLRAALVSVGKKAFSSRKFDGDSPRRPLGYRIMSVLTEKRPKLGVQQP